MVEKANRTLSMLKRTFESMEPKLWKDLYVSLVRPHLSMLCKRGIQCSHTNKEGSLKKLREYKEET